ncbi:MAG: DUF2007 domain-containing protein [Anaerolineae bacterium]|nr:DUF2007 domain-containing protein [Anaerolineae bacterium]
MSESNANTLPWPGQLGRAAETTPGGDEPVKWVIIRANLSPGEAVVIRGRLESEGIPTVLQQEAVGVVLGLTVGPLGSARVFVPEDRFEEAEAILAVTFEADEEEGDSF